MNANELLARAFQNDPFISWAEPDERRRHQTMSRVFTAMLAYAERAGGHLHEPGVGSVHWRNGAQAQMPAWALLTTGLWRVGLVAPPAVWLRLAAHEDAAMAEVVRHLGPHDTYFCTLGVEPALAGRGHGSRLLRLAFAEQALRSRRCVLRTEQPRNVSFYLRNGFEQVAEFLVPASGLRTWVFARSLVPSDRGVVDVLPLDAVKPLHGQWLSTGRAPSASR